MGYILDTHGGVANFIGLTGIRLLCLDSINHRWHRDHHTEKHTPEVCGRLNLTTVGFFSHIDSSQNNC